MHQYHALLTDYGLLLWILPALILLRRGQRLKGVFFILLCQISFMLQQEVLDVFNLNTGLTGWVQMDSDLRGLIGYCISVAFYLFLVILSPGSRGILLFAASLSLFLFTFMATSAIMIL